MIVSIDQGGAVDLILQCHSGCRPCRHLPDLLWTRKL